MANLLVFVFCIFAPLATLNAQQAANSFLDVEPPNFFQYNSPLRQPESLRSPQYFDFLSTLYRRDAGKAELFRPYVRQHRSIDDAPLTVPLSVSLSPVAASAAVPVNERQRRAVVFRPLFVYRQQQIRREDLSKRRRRV